MKAKLSMLIFLLAVSTAMFSCKKDTTTTTTTNNNNNNNNNQNQNTAKLKITFQMLENGSVSVAPYSTIQLFKTDQDRQNNTNPASAVTTADGNGVVIFSNLDPIDYYFNAASSDGTKTNAGGGTHTGALANNTTKSLSIVLK